MMNYYYFFFQIKYCCHFLGLWDSVEFDLFKKIASMTFTSVCLGENSGTGGLVSNIKLQRI